MASKHDASLARIAQVAIEELTSKHTARERGLRISREVIQLSANAIRAVHRHDFEGAETLIHEAETKLNDSSDILTSWPEIYYAGFLSDARKEYTEANVTLALISDRPIPEPSDLGVDMASYLNGMAEAVGELRRFILDSLRKDDAESCQGFLEVMDDIYSLLVTVDFPEGVTRGLRHTTDAMRGVLERTRGDLTMALRQQKLERKLAAFEKGVP